jgi:hypothetical protein
MWNMFTAETSSIAPPLPRENTAVRKLTRQELEAAMQMEGLTPHQIAELRVATFDAAYGVFVGDELAHISCVVTAADEREDTPVGLAAHEAEITYCVTFPRFRGYGLYPLAIQTLCHTVRSHGIERVFMKTARHNASSQRGILKAGLRRCGNILVFYSPLLFGKVLIHRGFRRIIPMR